MRRRRLRPRAEPTIALINILFLMLMFFLVAGTMAPHTGRDVTLVRTRGIEASTAGDALVIQSDGRLIWNGAPVGHAADILSNMSPENRARIRVIPDRDCSPCI